MRTRRVKRALNKIGQLMINDGIEENSELWKSFWGFRNKFVNYYKPQMRERKSKRMRFRRRR